MQACSWCSARQGRRARGLSRKKEVERELERKEETNERLKEESRVFKGIWQGGRGNARTSPVTT